MMEKWSNLVHVCVYSHIRCSGSPSWDSGSRLLERIHWKTGHQSGSCESGRMERCLGSEWLFIRKYVIPATYVLCEEEIQYWDRGRFMSSWTIGWGRGSQMEFSFENRKVRNWRRSDGSDWFESKTFYILIYERLLVFSPHPAVALARAVAPPSCSPWETLWHDSAL